MTPDQILEESYLACLRRLTDSRDELNLQIATLERVLWRHQQRRMGTVDLGGKELRAWMDARGYDE